MKKKKQIAWLFIVFLLLIPALAPAQTTYALVVGVGEYRDPAMEPLPGAVEDARQMALALERLHMASPEHIELMINPFLSDLLWSIDRWKRKGQEGDRLIFYYAGHGETIIRDGKPQLMLATHDTRLQMPERTAVPFEEDIHALARDKSGKEIIIILDACYSGGLGAGRSLTDPRILLPGVQDYARQGMSFLLSSGDKERSLHTDDGRGQFTVTLLQGMHGSANLAGEEILFRELKDYVTREVSQNTGGQQNPVFYGIEDKPLLQDHMRTMEAITTQITQLYIHREITLESFERTQRIINQPISQDSETESRIRNELIERFRSRRRILKTDIEYTDWLWTSSQTQAQPQIPEKPPTPDPQPIMQKGTCYLKIHAANELAKGGRILLNGIEKGDLSLGFLVVEEIPTGSHTLTLTGDTIDDVMITIRLDNPFQIKDIELKAHTATRDILIRTEPMGARLWIDQQPQSGITPIRTNLEVGREYTITAEFPGFNPTVQRYRIPVKGDLLPITLRLNPNQPPLKPHHPDPQDRSQDQSLDIVLNWQSSDPENDPIRYALYFGQDPDRMTLIASDLELNRYTLGPLQHGTTYYWKVDASDPYNHTQGPVWTFRTIDAPREKTFRITSNPSGAKITLNGADQGTTPLSITVLEGAHHITAHLQGYRPQERTLTFGSKDLARDETISFIMQPVTGTLQIQWNTLPDRILIDNQVVTGAIHYLAPGAYTIRLEKSGYDPQQRDAQIHADQTTIQSFQLQRTNRPPDSPELASPANRAQDQPTTLTLSWTGSDPDGDSLTYDLYLGLSQSAMTRHTSTTSTSRTISDLLEATTYYWKIVAKDGRGGETSSETRQFRTQEPPRERTYRITSTPEGASIFVNGQPKGATPLSITVKEEDFTITARMSGYREAQRRIEFDTKDLQRQEQIHFTLEMAAGILQIEWNAEPDRILINNRSTIRTHTHTLIAGSYTVTLEKRGHSTQTQTIHIHEGQTTTAQFHFERTNHPPDKPALLNPADHAKDQPLSVTVRWQGSDPDGDTLTYEVHLGTTQANMARVTTTQSQSLTLSNLKESTTYYWKVIAHDGQESTESETIRFTTRGSALTAPLRIETTPTRSGVYINGRFIGNTPLTTQIEQGSQRIEIRADQYHTHQEVLEVTSDRAINLRITLEPATDPLKVKLLAPANHITLTTGDVTLRWEVENLQGRTPTYEIHLSTDNRTFTRRETIVNRTTTMLRNLTGGVYYWKIICLIDGKKIFETEVFQFRVEVVAGTGGGTTQPTDPSRPPPPPLPP